MNSPAVEYMKPPVKAGLVAASYAAAFALACGVTYLRIAANANNPDVHASPGMYAFGDAVLFVFAFGAAALPPTGLALYFLRPVRRFWDAIAVGALLLMSTGVAAAMVYWAGRADPQWTSALSWWSALAVLRIIIAPFVTAEFVICALFTPEQRPRRLLWIAAVCEAAVAAPWFVWVFVDHVLRR